MKVKYRNPYFTFGVIMDIKDFKAGTYRQGYEYRWKPPATGATAFSSSMRICVCLKAEVIDE